jgi:hypothetical protein
MGTRPVGPRWVPLVATPVIGRRSPRRPWPLKHEDASSTGDRDVRIAGGGATILENMNADGIVAPPIAGVDVDATLGGTARGVAKLRLSPKVTMARQPEVFVRALEPRRASQ